MKEKLKKLHPENHLGGSWRTSLLGIVCILIAIRSTCVVWVPSQTVWFNVIYVLPGQIALLFTGIGLIHACDHKHIQPKP